MTADSKALLAGIRLKEYRIDSVLGTGAFGITYKAWDTNLDMAVAIKEFFPQEYVRRGGDDAVELKSIDHADFYEWGLQRFIGEAQVLAHLKHPNIVRATRYFAANKTAYFVMEYQQGASLGEHLQQMPEPPTEGWLRRLCIPLLEGLDQVHQQRYLHRDIKPGNIFIRTDSSPLLLDFGAARMEMVASEDEQTSILTPGYAPIEQYDANSAQGPWSDIYGLGATLYRCAIGKSPKDAYRREKCRQEGLPDPVSTVLAETSERYSREFLESIDWMMQLDSDDRPQSAKEVLARLQGHQQEQSAASFTYRPKRVTRNHKLIFTGPVGAGKTTAIHALSDIPPMVTDSYASDMTRQRKQATTVAMDYGLMKLSDTERVHLYGTPGQERFDFMWEILQKGGIGLILMIDNSRRDPFKDVDFFLHAFKDFIQQTRVVIGVTRMDVSQSPRIENYHQHLQAAGRQWKINPPIMEVDARNRNDVNMLVQALLFTLDPGVEDYDV